MKMMFLMFATAMFAVSCGGGTTSSSSNSKVETKATANSRISLTYPIVATGQVETFNNKDEIPFPKKGDTFYGQDAQHIYNEMSYTDNGDGTISDNNTGLMWQKGYKVLNYEQALEEVATLNKEDKYNDWRLPSIKELYSIMNFHGEDIVIDGTKSENAKFVPFINTNYFDFEYGSNGERIIDTQLLSSSVYTSTTMGGAETVFGLNVADGRIKGYGMYMRGKLKPFTVRFVRGNEAYGSNRFIDNEDNTISDEATGLMWAKEDSKEGMNWEDALAYVQNLNEWQYLGYSDWRLPNAKELHSIVDYSRSPDATDSPAISPLFNVSQIFVEDGSINYPEYWTSTTHKNMGSIVGAYAVYISFGESMGFLPVRDERQDLSGSTPPPPPSSPENMSGSSNSNTEYYLDDVHGAGAQRSDPKNGDPSIYPHGKGPQGDVVRVYNYIRVVRTIS